MQKSSKFFKRKKNDAVYLISQNWSLCGEANDDSMKTLGQASVGLPKAKKLTTT